MLGFIDYDMETAGKLITPNLEILKLSTFFKTEKRQFCRLLSLEEDNLDAYDKIYFFAENTECEIPQHFKQAKNVDFRGLVFTNGIYRPFKDPIIEYTLPRTFIYKNRLRQAFDDGEKNQVINHFLDDGYYRMYVGNERLPTPPVLPGNRIYLYDKEFFYPDWREIMLELTEKKPSSIVRLYPVVCHSLAEFFELRQYPKFARSNEVILDLPLPLGELNVLFKKYEKRFLADITISSNVYITLGGDLKLKKLYRDDFIYKINLLYSFWAKGIPLKIKYIKPQKQMINPIEELCLAVESWAALDTPVKRKDTLANRIKKGEKHEQFEDMKKFYKGMENLATQGFDILKERRYWNI